MTKVIRIAILSALAAVAIAGCDVQSGMTRKSLEEYTKTPEPVPSISPEPPIDPADVIKADISLTGPDISVNLAEGSRSVNCTKYNRVLINAHGQKVTIKGACRQLMINGDKAIVNAEGLAEIVFNGDNNSVSHSKFVNGNRPNVSDNGSGNGVEHTPAPAGKK